MRCEMDNDAMTADEMVPGLMEWTCGHHATAVCSECYRLLAKKAHELAEENMRLRQTADEYQAMAQEALDIAKDKGAGRT